MRFSTGGLPGSLARRVGGMMMRLLGDRRIRLIVLGFFVLGAAAVGASIAALARAPQDASALTERLDEVVREQERVRGKLRRVKVKQRYVTRQLNRLDARLERAEVRLRQASRSADRTQAELTRATRETEAADARATEHRANVADRLVAIYESGEIRPVEVLIQSASFVDFANRLYLLQQVAGRDAELLAQYDSSLTEARTRRDDLRRRGEQLQRIQKDVTAEQRRTTAERRVTAQEKRRILRDRAAWERALAELEQNSREIEGMLQRLQETPEGQARLAKAWTGGLQWPLKGRITSPFGYRKHPIYRVRKLHTGIDIAAPTGTSIRAAAGGIVVHAARWGGYGNCVVIDHGGGMATLYGHGSRLAVKKNQAVAQGQVIAYVGSTGLSTGPHLHFEVRKGGRPVDPKPLLP